MLTKSLHIARREIRSTFSTPAFYLILALFALMSGFFFFSILKQYNGLIHSLSIARDFKPTLNENVITPFFQMTSLVLIFFIPVLTMNAYPQEITNGTAELLKTSPISSRSITLGKLLSHLIVIVTCLSIAMIYPVLLIIFADPEVSPVICGIIGLLFFVLAYTSISLAISSFSPNALIAGAISTIVLFLFYLIDSPSTQEFATLSTVLEYLSPSNNLDNFVKGIFDGSSVIYFLSLTLAAVLTTKKI